MTTLPSDTTVISVNSAIDSALREYLDPNVVIRFDLPDPANLPSEPTISVFMYDLHEDLKINSAEHRLYKEGKLIPSKRNICCNYLITYWESNQTSSSEGPDSGPMNQAMLIMNQAMNAFINNRVLKGLPGTFTRVMIPKEELNSLGNFWQSLGSKPRLALNYMVTAPVSLTDHNLTLPKVEQVGATIVKQ
ncbi:Pvc16 family protein [Vibrio cyclitrophicus]